MTSNFRRISNELRFFREDPPIGCTGGPQDDNIYEWLCTVSAPANSPYSGHQFEFTVSFPANYPFETPVFVLENEIFHPNLEKGRVEVSTLQNWTPVQTVARVLEEVYELLMDPDANREVACNQEAARLLKEDVDTFAKRAQECM